MIMISIDFSLSMILLSLVHMLVSVDAASRGRRYNLVPFSSLQLTNHSATKHALAIFVRENRDNLLLRGGSNEYQEHVSGIDTEYESNLEERGDAWEEVIRKTREYYSSTPPLNKLSSSPKLDTAQYSHTETETTALTITPLSTEIGGEDGRAYGNAHSECDDEFLQHNHGGEEENARRDSTNMRSIVEIHEESIVIEDDVITVRCRGEHNTIDEIDTNLGKGNETQAWQNENDVEAKDNASDGFHEDEEDIFNQESHNEGVILHGIEDDQSVDNVEATTEEAEKQVIENQTVDEHNVNEDQNLQHHPETIISEKSKSLLVDLGERISNATTGDGSSQPHIDGIIMSDKEIAEVNAKEVDDRINTNDISISSLRNLQQRIGMLLSKRKKIPQKITFVLLGVALSFVSNSVRVSKKSTNADQKYGFQSSENAQPSNSSNYIVYDEEMDGSITASSNKHQAAELERKWLDKLLSFIFQRPRA